MILLDTSVLIDALTSPGRSTAALRRAIADGERILLSTLVLYEWLRGPRRPEELAAQEALFPRESAIPRAGDRPRDRGLRPRSQREALDTQHRRLRRHPGPACFRPRRDLRRSRRFSFVLRRRDGAAAEGR